MTAHNTINTNKQEKQNKKKTICKHNTLFHYSIYTIFSSFLFLHMYITLNGWSKKCVTGFFCGNCVKIKINCSKCLLHERIPLITSETIKTKHQQRNTKYWAIRYSVCFCLCYVILMLTRRLFRVYWWLDGNDTKKKRNNLLQISRCFLLYSCICSAVYMYMCMCSVTITLTPHGNNLIRRIFFIPLHTIVFRIKFTLISELRFDWIQYKIK